MRSLLLAFLCVLNQGLRADPASDAALTPTALVTAVAVNANALSPTSDAQGLSPAAMVTMVASPVPTPTAVPFVERKGRSDIIRLVDPSWAIALKAGASLPLGDLAQFNQPGPATSLDLLYHADASFSVDSFLSYASQASKVAGTSQPLTNIGLGVKLLYNIAEIDGVTWYAGAGVGAYYDQRSKQVLLQPVLNNTPQYNPEADSSFGLGVLGALGGRYQGVSGWGFMLEINLVGINLAGGTSDSLLLAQPMIGVSYGL